MKFLALLLLFSVSALSPRLSAQTDLRTVLATSAKNGVTTTLYVGRIQADPAKDGTITITVFPQVVKTDSAGAVISDALDTAHPFPLTLTAAQYAGLATLVKAAYLASLPPAG